MKLRKACKIGLLSLLLSPLSAKAQTPSAPGVVSLDASGSVYGGSVPMGFNGGFWWARGDVGERPGVEGDYFSTGAFAPLTEPGSPGMLFLEGQLWVNENAEAGGDLGLGYRQRINDWSAAGVNVFGTYDHSELGDVYRRVSIGGEFMTDYLGANINGYIPVSSDINNIGAAIPGNTIFFQGRNLFFNNLQLIEQQVGGVDFEVGTPIPRVEFLSAYVGGYTFSGDDVGDFNGASFRASVDLTSAVFDLTVQNDDRFGTTVNFGAELRAGAGQLTFAPRYRTLENQLLDRVRKRARITVNQGIIDSLEVALNPADNLPYEFVHVDNTAGPGGTGTDEDRFNNLGLASGSGADIILVHRGTTTRANLLPSGTGLVLDDGQIVLGEGVPFMLQTANRPNPVALPDWDQTGPSPFVGGAAGVDIITLADNNMILGLNMVSTGTGNMIAGNGIENFFIRDINIDIAAGQDTGSGGGIMLTDASGMGQITRFNYRADNVDAAAGGIIIDNTSTADLSVNIQDSAFIEGGNFGIRLSADDSEITSTIANVRVDSTGTALSLEASNNGELDINAPGNLFNNSILTGATTGNNIQILGTTGGEIDFAAGLTNARAADVDNILVDLDDALATIDWGGGSLVDAGDDAIDLRLANGSEALFSLRNAPGVNAGDNAIEVQNSSGSVLQVAIDGGNFINAGNNGISANLDSGSTTIFLVDNSTFEGAGATGMTVNATGGAIVLGDIADSSFDNVGGTGIDWTLTGSMGLLELADTTVENAGGNGIRMRSLGGSAFDASFENVSLDNAGAVGLFAQVTGVLSEMEIDADNVTGENAGLDGMRFVVNGGSLTGEFDNTGSFANAGSSGMRAVNDNGGQLDLTFDNGSVDFSNAGHSGLRSTANNGSSSSFAFLDGANFDDAQGNVAGTGDAISQIAMNGSSTSVTGSEISGANAARNGIHLDVSGGSDGTVNISEIGSFANATGDGLTFAATGGSQVNINLTGTSSFDGAGGNGVSGTMVDSDGTVVLNGLTFDGAGLAGADISLDASNLGLALTDVTFNDAALDAFQLGAINGSLATLAATNVGLENAGGDAIDVDLLDSAFNAILSNITGTNAGGDGLGLTATNSDFDIELTNGSFDDAGGNGLSFDLGAGSFGSFDATNVSASNTFGFAMLSDIEASIFVAALQDVDLNDAGSSAFALSSTAGSDVTITGDNVSGANAGGDGISVVSTDSVTSVVMTNLGSFANAAGDGVNAEVTGGTFQDFTLDLSGPGGTPADFTGAGGNGLSIVLQDHDGFDAGTPIISIDNLDFSDATGDGFSLVSNNSTFNALITNTLFANAGDNAFIGILDQNSPNSDLTILNSDLSNATTDAVHIEATNNTVFNVDIIGSDISGAGQDTTDVSQDGTSTVNLNIAP